LWLCLHDLAAKCCSPRKLDITQSRDKLVAAQEVERWRLWRLVIGAAGIGCGPQLVECVFGLSLRSDT
jgi:hypothetical protein